MSFHPDRLNMIQNGHPDDARHWDASLDYGVPEEGEVPPPVKTFTGSNNEPLGRRRSPSSTLDGLGPDVGNTPMDEKDKQLTPPPFDFGSGMPLPPPKAEGARQAHQRTIEEQIRAGSLFQKLGKSHDPTLLGYLQRRHITPNFLNEIDKFLANHPEIAGCAPRFVQDFNSLTPFDAYRYFLKGYTRPARYVPGHLPEGNFVLPWGFKYERLANAVDEELIGFFEGHDYRYDILEEIDAQVAYFVAELQQGQLLKRADRMLVVYAVWGNPVDAYKYFEYNYQTKWLKHRYLSEHIVLDDIPRQDGYSLPHPQMTGDDEGHRGHYIVRLRMARAADEGVDVLDVLLNEFTAELARKGHRRDHIERRRREAKDAIDRERDDPVGRDIVTMVMGMADTEPRIFRPVVVGNSGPAGFTVTTNSGGTFIFGGGQSLGINSTAIKQEPMSSVPATPAHILPMGGARTTSGVFRGRLRGYKNMLENLNEVLKTNAPALSSKQRKEINNTRRKTERLMVQALCQLGSLEKTMSKAAKTEILAQFTRKKQLENEAAGKRVDVLKLYKQYT